MNIFEQLKLKSEQIRIPFNRNVMNKKELILSLIKDDLIHVKLIYSFERLGFHSDCYFLHLGSTIFELMGFKNCKESDEVFDRYMELSEKATVIDITESNERMEKLALEIYDELCTKVSIQTMTV